MSFAPCRVVEPSQSRPSGLQCPGVSSITGCLTLVWPTAILPTTLTCIPSKGAN